MRMGSEQARELFGSLQGLMMWHSGRDVHGGHPM